PRTHPLSLHDALPISKTRHNFPAVIRQRGSTAPGTSGGSADKRLRSHIVHGIDPVPRGFITDAHALRRAGNGTALFDRFQQFHRSEEHTSELQSREKL